MKQNIIITFGLPCYNVEHYVEQCVQSIVSQKIDIKYEILCVDDCSTDNTVEVICQLMSRYENLRLYRNEKNKGVSHTRNCIIENSRGTYIWFVDPDDMLFPGVINYMYSIAEQHNADWCCANYVEYNEGYIPSSESLLQEFDCIHNLGNGITDGFNIVPMNLNQYGAIGASVCVGLWKTSFINCNRLRFNEKIGIMEDMLFKLQSEAYDRNVVHVNYPVYIYRIREHSATTETNNASRKMAFESRLSAIDALNNMDTCGNELFQQKVIRLVEEAKEDAVCMLTKVDDKDYVKRMLSFIKKKKYYPYKFRSAIIKKSRISNLLRNLNTFLMPIEPVFWLNNYVRRIYKLFKYRDGEY